MADPLFVIVTYGIIAMAIVLIVYPLYFIVIASVSDPNLVQQGKVVLFPRGITFDGYLTIFGTSTIVRGFLNSVVYTAVGTVVSVSMILFGAYALSRKEMPGRNLFMILFVITMFFDGGMIARYLVVKELGLLDSYWALILPMAINPFNLIVIRTFFQQLPHELREAAEIDGANEFTTFWRIMLPLSKPVIATFSLFYAVALWNDFMSPLLYISDSSKWTLQMFVRQVTISSDPSTTLGNLDPNYVPPKEGLKFAVIVIATLPIMCVYPFLQKHFAKGVMIGSVKG